MCAQSTKLFHLQNYSLAADGVAPIKMSNKTNSPCVIVHFVLFLNNKLCKGRNSLILCGCTAIMKSPFADNCCFSFVRTKTGWPFSLCITIKLKLTKDFLFCIFHEFSFLPFLNEYFIKQLIAHVCTMNKKLNSKEMPTNKAIKMK